MDREESTTWQSAESWQAWEEKPFVVLQLFGLLHEHGLLFLRTANVVFKSGVVKKNKFVLAKGIGVFLPRRIKHEQLTEEQRCLRCPPSSFSSHCSNEESPGWLLIVYADASFFPLAPGLILQINSSSLKPPGIRTPESSSVAFTWASRINICEYTTHSSDPLIDKELGRRMRG